MKLKNSIYILLSFFFISSCGESESVDQDETQTDTEQPESEKTSLTFGSYREFEVNSKGESTKYEFDFNQALPGEFHFDTLLIKKTDKNADYRAYYLQSTDPLKKTFNQHMLNAIILNIESDAEFVDMQDEDDIEALSYSYELGPFEFFMDEKVISMCYVVDSYLEGGNHHNYGWYTFNYDVQSQNVLRAEDIFVLETAEDSAALLRDIRQNMEGGSECQDLFEPFQHLDFSFVREGLVMNPYLSWACGMRRSLLKKDQDFATIKEEWK